LQNLLNVAVESEHKGLFVNRQKSMCMVIGYIEVVGHSILYYHSNGDKLKQVDHFIYLGSLISQDGRCDKEIKRRIGISKNIFHNIEKVLTSRAINMSTKLRLLKCYVWSTLLYGCESWTVSQRMKSKLEATEMWFYDVCCVLHALIKCQMKKYFKEPIRQEIS